MTLSIRLGEYPTEVMKKTTWRWYRTWLEKEHSKWPTSGPIDMVADDPVLYYLSRIAQRVQQVLSRNPGSIKLDDQLILFVKKVNHQTRKEAARHTKSMFKSMFSSMNVEIVYKKKKGPSNV